MWHNEMWNVYSFCKWFIIPIKFYYTWFLSRASSRQELFWQVQYLFAGWFISWYCVN
jgi:hypothetical protein